MMKKFLMILIAVIGFGFAANANCSFAVTSANANPQGTTVTITVNVRPTFTPTEDGFYTIVVVPTGQWARILGSQRQETTARFQSGSWMSINPVIFTCSLMDNSVNQCTSNDFRIDQCFKR